MSEVKERVQKEYDELQTKLEKLDNFIGSKNYFSLREIDRLLLVKQEDVMKDYLDILRFRLSIME